jgi:uncharacterized membrane protein YfcA
MDFVLIVVALISGAFIGSVLGFVGAGGAMVSVPIFIYLFNFSPASATTASLAVVGAAAIAGLRPKIKSKDVLLREGIIIWFLGLTTNIGFALLVLKIPNKVILIGFSLVLLVAAYSMLQPPKFDLVEKKMPWWALIILSLIIGSLSGLFGIGGGFLAIPVLVLFFNTSPSKAAGTSLFIIALNCLTALFAKVSIWDQIQWGYPILIAISAIFTAQAASKLATKTPTVHLKQAFAFLLLAISGFTILTSLIG